MNSKTYVVVGASAASIAFISKLRTFDTQSKVICLSGESHTPYNRCLLADYVQGNEAFDGMLLKPIDYFTEHAVDLRLNTWVTSIDALEKVVYVGSEKIAYDTLFLGIGTRPYIPEMYTKIESGKTYAFHTAAHAEELLTFVKGNPSAVVAVIGAGLNGIECASALTLQGIRVIMIERNEQIVSRCVDADTADYIYRCITDNGITCRVNTQVVHVVHTIQDDVYVLSLHDGTELRVDAIVCTTGSRLNSELLEGTGIALYNGSIIVDEHMRTNIPDIMAGGDICVVPHMITKVLTRSTTWSDAMLQGLCAATYFHEKPRCYAGYIGLQDSVFFTKPFYMCGTVFELEGIQKVVFRNDTIYEVLYFKDQVIVGFVLIGSIERLALYKQYYLTQKPYIY